MYVKAEKIDEILYNGIVSSVLYAEKIKKRIFLKYIPLIYILISCCQNVYICCNESLREGENGI